MFNWLVVLEVAQSGFACHKSENMDYFLIDNDVRHPEYIETRNDHLSILMISVVLNYTIQAQDRSRVKQPLYALNCSMSRSTFNCLLSWTAFHQNSGIEQQVERKSGWRLVLWLLLRFQIRKHVLLCSAFLMVAFSLRAIRLNRKCVQSKKLRCRLGDETFTRNKLVGLLRLIEVGTYLPQPARPRVDFKRNEHAGCPRKNLSWPHACLERDVLHHLHIFANVVLECSLRSCCSK